METVIKKDVGGTVSTYHYSNETAATRAELSSVTYTVYKPGGSTLVSQTSITADSDGKMNATISSANAANLLDYCRVLFQYTYDSQVYTQHVYFHVAKTSFDIPAHNADLIQYEPDLANMTFSGDTKHYKQRATALNEIYERFVSEGYEPWKILNLFHYKTAFTYLWLSHVFMAQSKSSQDFYERALQYRDLYNDAFKKIVVIEDTDEDANIGAEPTAKLRVVKLVRG